MFTYFNDLVIDIRREILNFLSHHLHPILRLVCRSWSISFFPRVNYHSVDTVNYAAEQGYLTLLIWLKQYIKLKNPCLHAIEFGQIHIIKWIKKEGFSIDKKAFDHAAKANQLKTLKWLRKNKHSNSLYNWSEQTFANATIQGDVTTLRWLKRKGCPWDLRCTNRAAEMGHIHILEWLQKHGCPWNHWACVYACRGGHLNVLKWLIRHKCPIDIKYCVCAARGKHDFIVEWLKGLDRDCVLKTLIELNS